MGSWITPYPSPKLMIPSLMAWWMSELESSHTSPTKDNRKSRLLCCMPKLAGLTSTTESFSFLECSMWEERGTGLRLPCHSSAPLKRSALLSSLQLILCIGLLLPKLPVTRVHPVGLFSSLSFSWSVPHKQRVSRQSSSVCKGGGSHSAHTHISQKLRI